MFVLCGTTNAASIGNVTFSIESPADLPFHDRAFDPPSIYFSFDYAVDTDSYIFGWPVGLELAYFGGSGSMLYPAGTSGRSVEPGPITDGNFFSVFDLGQGVTQIDTFRIFIYHSPTRTTLYETFIDVDYTFGAEVPLPATLWLFGTALLGLSALKRK